MGIDQFPVLLADDFLIYGGAGITSDLAEAFGRSGKTPLTVMEVDGLDISMYGVVAPSKLYGGVSGLVEKPADKDAPSNLVIINRYVLTSDIFDILCNQPAGLGGEIQLT